MDDDGGRIHPPPTLRLEVGVFCYEMIKAIRNSGFWSRYLDYVKKEKQDEELFCEYYANKVKRYIS